MSASASHRVRAIALVFLMLASVLAPVVSAGAIASAGAADDGTVTGEVSIDAQGATDGSQFTYNLSDASRAGEVLAQLTGRKSTESESVSGTALVDGDTLPYVAAGTRAPESAHVTFTGAERTRGAFWSGTASNGGVDSVTVGGNLAPTDATIQFTGSESSSANSWSATSLGTGDTTTFTVGGSVAPENTQVTFTGRETSGTLQTVSGTETDGGTASRQIAGNRDPSSVSIQFTGQSERIGSELNSFIRNSKGSGNADAAIAPDGETIYTMDNDRLEAHPADATLPGSSLWEKNGVTTFELTPDGKYLYVTSGANDHLQKWNATDGSVVWEVSLSSPSDLELSSDGSAIYVDRGGAIDVYDPSGTFQETIYSGSGVIHRLELSHDGNTIVRMNSGRMQVISTSDGSVIWSNESTYSDVAGLAFSLDDSTIYVAGNGDDLLALSTADGTVQWSKTGNFREVAMGPNGNSLYAVDGTSIRAFSPDGSTEQWSVSHAGNAGAYTHYDSLAVSDTGKTVLYNGEEIVRTEAYRFTEDPSVDVDGDGAADASYTGILKAGETVTRSVSILNSGSQTLTFSTTTSTAVDWSLSYVPEFMTEDPSVDVNGDGTADASYMGTLSSGQTATVSLSNLGTGSITATTFLTAGSVDWTIAADEVTATKDPSVDVGGDGSTDAVYTGVIRQGETKTVSIQNLSTGDNSLVFATASSAPTSWKIEAIEHMTTEDPAIDVDGDGTTDASYTGKLAPGESVTRDVSLSLGSQSATIGTYDWSGVDVQLAYTEVSESQNPRIVINGNQVAHEGTLAAGETATLSPDRAWLVNGTNSVTVHVGESLSANAPTPTVDVLYSHAATTSHATTYNATAWRETRSINKTFVESQSNATVRIPFHSSVLEVSSLETAWGEADLSPVNASQYEYTNGTVVLELGDVEANSTLHVRAVGRRVKVANGEIAIRDPTLPGNELDTQIELVEKGDGFWLGLPDTQVVHAYDESWNQPADYVRVDANGFQRLYLPGASVGSTARVEYTPLVVEPQLGDVVVEVQELGDSPKFRVSPGQTGGDDVEYRWLSVIADKQYALYSLTAEDTRATSRATVAAVSFMDDDSEETLQIVPSDDVADRSLFGPFGLGEGIRGGLVLMAGAGALALVYYAQRRWGNGLNSRKDWVVLGTVSASVMMIALEAMAPGAVATMLTAGAIPALGGVVLAIVVLYYATARLPVSRRVRWSALGVGSLLLGVVVLEVVSPGSAAPKLGDMLASGLDPIVRLGGLVIVGLGGLVGWQLYKRWRSNSSSSSSKSSGPDVNVFVSDDDDGGSNAD